MRSPRSFNVDAAANLAAGSALLVAGVENGLVARRTTRGRVLGLTAVDLLFAVGVLWVAIADPTGAQTWMRWMMVGLADAAVTIGIVKIVGVRSLDSARVAVPMAA